ncbi:DUF3034 family protein [Aquidulcibacter paucihalophilus]|uniref:DUF3034 family protein n=1 Tax=Aquidulcibacter paucihalophilus TaxID=1978549 RepID=UPI000A18F0F4|nr:DUF3034 family protein [Aquidulcibacter paucihalophilus]
MKRVRAIAAYTLAAFLLAMVQPSPSVAQDLVQDMPQAFSGRLKLTGGVNQIEGAAGGGFTPWALIGGYGTKDQVGGAMFATQVTLDDFTVQSFGGLIGWRNRLEISAAQQSFDTREVGAALGLGRGFKITQNTMGLKIRLVGDAVLDQDRLLPQIAVGAQFKSNDRGGLVRALGAQDSQGTDYYVSATKLFLAHSTLVNLTVRSTQANQYGILGFGGLGKGRSLESEGSIAYLPRQDLAFGFEWRTKPDNLAIAKEEAAMDLFVAYAPTKNWSVTAGYADLGHIVTRSQTGLYVSVNTSF